MSELGIIETYVSRLHRDLDAVIITPRFTSAADGATAQLDFDEEACCISGRAEESSPEQIIHDVGGLINFLTRCLPKNTYTLLLERLLPSLMVQIITNYFEPSVPISLDQIAVFKDTLSRISDLAQYINGWGIPIPSDGDLSAWVNRLPQIWLARRREAALITMRSTCYEGVQTKKNAERVETQMVSSDDVMVSGAQHDENLNDSWSEEREHVANKGLLPSTEELRQGDEEDASAWGLVDDPVETQQESQVETTGEDEDESWGWGEEEVTQEQQRQETVKPMASGKFSQLPRTQPNGSAKKHASQAEHEITLRETFTISAIPDGVLELIDQILSDAETLSQPSFSIPSISAAATALSSLPTLLLALYRATARNFYASDPASDMLIYNDSQDLAIRLHSLVANMSQNHPLFKRLASNLEADIKLLHTHSRLAYGREMDSQRTILADLLSSTSGFTSCTNPLNAREYSNAISDVVHRILDLDKVWKTVLSNSARLQSLGAILSHVIRKITTDVLELADEPRGISEEESKQLKTFIDQISQLATLFEEDTLDGNREKRSFIHVYTPSWLRFVYLGEILEASLADIKFLWTDGELSLEFEASEVVDLIEALFAESQFRRDAIRDIKRGGLVLR
jgi:centromere/kinetochore protein ZW10